MQALQEISHLHNDRLIENDQLKQEAFLRINYVKLERKKANDLYQANLKTNQY
jgi:hypothetical protein